MPRASANHTAPRDRLVDHLPALRAMLEHQRQFRLEQLAELDALVEATAPTTADDRARHEVAINLMAAARHALADINGALALVATGGYGRCRDCHADIPLHLLRAFPASHICLRCRQPHAHHRTAGTACIPLDAAEPRTRPSTTGPGEVDVSGGYLTDPRHTEPKR